MHPSTSPDVPISRLRTEVTGRVVAPGDPGYDELRAIGEGGFDYRPAIIIRPADARDVVVAVRLARETGLELAVRSGGHSSAGFGTTDGGIVVDMRDLVSFDLDPADRSAWVGAGFTARELTGRAVEHGLVIPLATRARWASEG